ncbi:MAG: transposase [Desulfococcaceae bacterium]
MKEESEPGTAFLFGDGMHLVRQNVPKRYRGRPGKPMILETNTGRTRLNILGVCNAETRDFEHLAGEENCDGGRAIEFLGKASNGHRKAPSIGIFLDNAKCFRAKIGREWLKNNPRLRLEFLPAYSSNLNLTERFWRLAKDVLVKKIC